MSVITRVQQWAQKRFLSIAGLDHLMDMAIGGQPTYVNKMINEKTAMEYTALYACVRILSETLAYLPLILYERLEPRGKRRASEHPLHNVLHNEANPYMSSFVWRELMQQHLATWGNAYAQIDRVGPRIESLWPLRPDRIEIEFTKREPYYIYTMDDGQKFKIKNHEMLHIKGPGYDGYKGYSPVGMHRQAIGMGLSVEEYGARFFASGGKPGGVIKHPGRLKEEGRDNLRESWQKMHAGLKNQHKVAILEEGMEYQQIGIPPEDAQFLKTREFQLQEMARIYRIPLHMLADLGRVTYNNIEHMGIDFVVHTMGPWLKRWEQELTTKLLTTTERKKYFPEFLVEGLLRGDTQTRFAAYSTARQWGWMSADDVRELENMNPLPDDQGETYLVPMNMISADEVKDREPAENVPQQPEKKSTEVRARTNRDKLAKRYEPLFKDAAGRIINREAADIRRAAKRLIDGMDTKEFIEWVEEFYDTAPEWMRKVIAPVIRSYVGIMVEAAMGEVGAADVDIDDLTERLTDGFVNKRAGQGRGQLRSLIMEVAEEASDPVELVNERMGNWTDTLPEKIAKHESVFCAGHVARAVFVAAGVVKLVVRNTGSKTCEFCEMLDGKVVGVQQPIIGANESIDSKDGAGKPLRVSGPKFTPPFHRGCVCQILPS